MAMASAPSPPPIAARQGHDDEYVLVWREEFDYCGLPDPLKWEYHAESNNWVHDERHNEAQWYMSGRLENSRVEDGVLKLTARREESWIGEPYTSARIRTRGNGDWLYGYFEVRAKLPAGKPGVWPAIWLMPTDKVYGSWPKSGEIDVMESVGYLPGKIHAAVHTEAFNHRIKTERKGDIDIETAHEEFHVYSIEWEETKIEFFVDGQSYFRFDRTTTQGTQQWPFDQRFHIILNVAVGGHWGGAKGIDATAFPTTFEIDYVRVFQKNRRVSVLPPPPLPPGVGARVASFLENGEDLLKKHLLVVDSSLLIPTRTGIRPPPPPPPPA